MLSRFATRIRPCRAVVLAALVVASGIHLAGARAATSVSTFAGSVCSASSARSLALQPTGVVADGTGGFYFAVADAVHSVVCHVDSNGATATAAGDGTPGYMPAPYGDNVPAGQAEVYNPHGLAVFQGSLFIADQANNRVRKVSSSGTISTVAGTGAAGSAGDGGSATSAQLNAPTGMAVDASGNLFITERSGARVRRVTPTGVITTVAGTGLAGYSGDGGRATQAQLNQPTGTAIDATGNLYIADAANNRVRKVSPWGIITTAIGTGSAGYSGDNGLASLARVNHPAGVTFDKSGNLYLADSNNRVVRRMSTNGIITTVAGNGTGGFSGDGGPATSAQLSWPLDVTLDSSGGLLIADNGFNNRIRRVFQGMISTVAGNGTAGLSGDRGPAVRAQLSEPIGVAVDGTTTYIADTQSEVVRAVDGAGTITTVIGTDAGLNFPTGLAVDGNHTLYVADSWNNRVLSRRADGTVAVVAGSGVRGYAGDGGQASAAQLNDPSGLAVDASLDLYVADSGNNVVRVVDQSGQIATTVGTGSATDATHPLGDGGPATAATLNNPTGVAVAPRGLLIADRNNQRIRLVSGGVISTAAGTGAVGYSGENLPATSSRLNYPAGVATDAAGSLIISDTGNCVIRRVDAGTGSLSTIAGWTPMGGTRPICGYTGSDGNGMLNDPTAAALGDGGAIYVADSLNNRVRKVVT